MPTPITAHPGSFVPAPYSGAPTALSVDAARSSAAAGHSPARGAQGERPAPPSRSLSRNEDVRSDETGPAVPPPAASSDAFLAQRIAQETQDDHVSAELLATAQAAYLRMRDSHIQLLPARTALDLRV